MLKGRLGLEGAEIRHKHRHPFVSLSCGKLYAEDGAMTFENASRLVSIPYQTLSAILLGPGTTVTHDVLRLAARHGVSIIATGADGVRSYTAPPLYSDVSELARKQATYWADPGGRLEIIERQFRKRFGGNFTFKTVEEARGLEGVRVREAYKLHARRYGLKWTGRNTGRLSGKGLPDDANNALNHASVAIVACATTAVSCTGTIPQLGFLHEDSGKSFILDIADLYKTKLTIPVAFQVAAQKPQDLERSVRHAVGQKISADSLIDAMIHDIEDMLW